MNAGDQEEEKRATQTPSPVGVDETPIRVDTHVVLVDPDYETRARIPWSIRAVRVFFSALGAIAPRAAGWLAERMFYAPRRHAIPAREDDWLRSARREDVHVDGTRVATYRWGDGPKVLLLHGWEGRGTQLGAFVEPLVEAGFEAIAVDLPAHGESAGKETDAFTCGRVVHGLAEREGGVHAIIGHSFGGSCAVLAMSEGLVTQAAVLICPGVQGDTFFNGFATIVGLPPRATKVLRRRVISRFGEEHWDQFSARGQGYTLSSGAARALLVHDIHDVEVPYTESVQLVHHTEGARLLSTRGLGHRRILRDPSVVEAVVSFVQGEDNDAVGGEGQGG